jgi:BirA family biotin operon repressor/biotin-[acetyl-CoA-carboxylase] ligase
MDVASALARAGAPHGTVVEAGVQTAGRGRQGKRWQTGDHGSLLSSWILRLPAGDDRPPILSPLIALALLRVIRELAPTSPLQFKWPNDVLIDGRKVAGILPTVRRSVDHTLVIAGIGINVAACGVPDDIVATSLDEWCHGVSITNVRLLLAKELATVLDEATPTSNLIPFHLEALRSALVWTGQNVDVVTTCRTITGLLITIAADGALVIRPTSSQDTVSLYVGELVRGPRKTEPVGV